MTAQIPPVSAPASVSNNRGFAIASLVLGIISLCGSVSFWCGGLLGLIGIVLGALGINSRNRSMAIAGIVLSAIGLILALVFRVVFRGILFNHLLPQFLQGRGL